MTSADGSPHLCDVREFVREFALGFTPPLHVAIDPRVPRYLLCTKETLERELRQIVQDLTRAKTLIVYEMDDPGRRVVRFEIPETQAKFDFNSQEAMVAEPGPHGTLKILVVEDNLVNQEVARECLRALGYQCDIAVDGAAAVAAASLQQYDIILMDIHMPLMDGLEATRRIRQLPGGQAPFITALTAYSLPGDRELSRQAGMDDYLTKPCRLEILAGVLRKAIGRKI